MSEFASGDLSAVWVSKRCADGWGRTVLGHSFGIEEEGPIPHTLLGKSTFPCDPERARRASPSTIEDLE